MLDRSQRDGILTLRLTHGKAHALDVELLDALQRELDGPALDARAVILTGTDSIFSAGVDLVRLTREGPDYIRCFLPLMARFFRTLFAFPRPVVAACNGHAIAGGCIMLLAADLRVMADGPGLVGVPELLVGVPFPAAALEIVRFAVPRDHVQTLIYTGRTMSPAEALTAGLVDQVVAPGELESRAHAVAEHLARIPAASFRLTKAALRAEALQRIDRAESPPDAAVLEAWTAAKTLEHMRDYVRRTLRK